MEEYYTVKMELSIDVDRPFTQKHYVSPGSFEIEFENGMKIPFDFYMSERQVSADRKTLVFLMRDLDTDSFPYAKFLGLCLSGLKIKSFNEFYIFPGDYGDDEIYVEKVNYVMFYLYDKMNGQYIDVDVGERIVNKINQKFFSKEVADT